MTCCPAMAHASFPSVVLTFDVSCPYFTTKQDDTQPNEWLLRESKVLTFIPGFETRGFPVHFDKKAEKLLQEKKVSPKIVDFCLQSDISGSIRYGACKEILKTIGDYDDNICYGYAGRSDCAMFRDFKAILEDCIRLKCDMVWD